MTCVVVSGLPGSGKSTLARHLAPLLALPVLDKDDILEGLFEGLGVGDHAWRSRLSRAADTVFCRLASSLGPALLVSWWRHPASRSESGTPTSWLASLPAPVVEVHCACPASTAAERFLRRRRHAGHLDEMRTPDGLAEEFEQLARLGPLGCGPVISVATDSEVLLDPVVAFVRRHHAAA